MTTTEFPNTSRGRRAQELDGRCPVHGAALEVGPGFVSRMDLFPGREFEAMQLALPFCAYAPVLFASALTGQRVHKLLDLIVKVRESHTLRIATGPLNRWLKDATTAHHPPVSKSGHPIRLYFASQPRVAPPTIMISTNDPDGVHFSYQRFLINQFREHFECVGTPIKLQFRGKNNPFDNDEEG